MRKIVISGGPHTGKTSLLQALEANHPQYSYTPEPASAVLEELALKNGNYWRDIFDSPLRFCTACMWKSLQLEKAIDTDKVISFQDRSLVDTIAYSRRDGCVELVPLVRTLAQNALYDTVLFCEPVGEIEGRIETRSEARTTHTLLKEAYEEMNISFISIPAIELDARVRFVEDVLSLRANE